LSKFYFLNNLFKEPAGSCEPGLLISLFTGSFQEIFDRGGNLSFFGLISGNGKPDMSRFIGLFSL